MEKTETQATASDTIANNRNVGVPDPSVFPPVLPGYQPTELRTLRKSLRTIPQNARAEAISALETCAQQGDDLRRELGPNVPSSSEVSGLAARLQALRLGKARLISLLDCYEELEDIAYSDAESALEAIWEEHLHFVHKRPQLAEKYSFLKTYFQDRDEAIRKGIAESRRRK